MHTAKLLSLALETARNAGYEIREEVLDGAGGGHCTIRGKKCLLLDVTQSHREQLSDVVDALRAEPNLNLGTLHPLVLACVQETAVKAA